MERLDALGSPELRAVLALLRSATAPLTADDVAGRLDLPRSVARWRLERLVEAGVAESAFASRVGGRGAGRPAKTYAAAPETRALEFPAHRYERLLALLAASLPRTGRASKLGAVGEAFGRELARAARLRPPARREAAFERLCRGLGRLGFPATVESADENGALLVTPTCPLRPLVVEGDDARAIDEGMWRGLVASVLPREPAEIRCHAEGCHQESEACRVTISLRRPASRASG